MNPLEHHTFRELLSKREQVCGSSEGTFTLVSYHYTFMNYFKGRIQSRWWHYITCSNLSKFIKETGLERGLLTINGLPTCLGCLTNEYVKSDKKLNGGTATCLRCNSIDKGWGA